MKTKELLSEWKSFLENDMLNEISHKKFQDKFPEFDSSNFSPQLKGNADYLEIIKNSIESGQQHGPIDYIQQFEFYKASVEPNRNNQEFLTVVVPGEEEAISLLGKVNQGSCKATYDDIQQFQQARMFALGKGSKNKLTAAYERILADASPDDFELIADSDNWIVYYPKTIRGSISLARSYWDGNKITYDKTFNASKGFGKNTGIMRWCTSVSGAGNMFINYHRVQNLHMYYCINKKVESINSPIRKLCISYRKSLGKVDMAKDNTSCVNANNEPIDENYIVGCMSETVSNLLYKDAESSKRLEIDMNSFYRSISLDQYITMRNANEESLEDFVNEFVNIIRLSKDRGKIYVYSLNDNSEHIISELINYTNSEEEILLLYNKWKDSIKVKRAISIKGSIIPDAVFEEMLSDDDKLVVHQLKTSDRISLPRLMSIAKGNSLEDKSSILYNKNLPLEIIKILLDDENENIRETASEHPTNLKHDLLTNDLYYLRQKSRSYKKALLNNENLLTQDIIEVLAFDDNIDVSSSAISHDKCPISVLKDARLLKHEDYSVRQAIAMNDKAPVSVIQQLAKDDHFRVSDMAKRNTNFRPEVQSESKLIKKYIRLFLS